MRRALLAVAAYLFAIGLVCLAAQAQFFQPAFIPPKAAGGGGCTTSQWDVLNKGADISTSGSPCLLTFSGGHATLWENVRGTTSKSGTVTSYYVEFTINTIGANAPLLGVGDGSETFGPGSSPGPYCGHANDSVCYQPSTGAILRSGTAIATIFTATAGDVIGMKVDMSGFDGTAWAMGFNKNGGAFSMTTLNTLPSTSGTALYLFGGALNSESNATLNVCPASPPAGYSCWN